jgi:hypothetical protein
VAPRFNGAAKIIRPRKAVVDAFALTPLRSAEIRWRSYLWCDQISTQAENLLSPYSGHSCAQRHSQDFEKLCGD